MHQTTYLPESTYTIDPSIDYRKLESLYIHNSSVSGIVTRLDQNKKLLEVSINENLTAKMNFSDATIYPIYNDNGELSPNVYRLVGKKIRAKITDFYTNDIFLSRKENMLEALKHIKTKTIFNSARIVGFSRMCAFIDVGEGIIGKSYGKDFSIVIYKDIHDLGLKIGDIIPVKVIEFFENDNRFELSRVDVLPSHYDYFTPGDVLTCKVFGNVENDPHQEGYFVLIDSTFCGIVDSPNVKLDYGDLIIATVKKLKDDGLKLNFLEKLNF